MDNFNNLKYNLYELLNVSPSASTEQIKKSYKKIILRFHPDKTKITPLEEELYYAIVEAHAILTNEKKRYNYNTFLQIKNNTSYTRNNSNFEYQSISHHYVPPTKEEAAKSYDKQVNEMYNRHGAINVKEKLSVSYKKKIAELKNLPDIEKEHFRDTDDFNKVFTSRKRDGKYSDKIVKYTGEIVSYEPNSSLGLTSLSERGNLYSSSTVSNGKLTSISLAHTLQPHFDIEEEEYFDYDTYNSNYQKTTEDIAKAYENGTYNNMDFLNNI
jgi:curved DNA-binding protein CbpA